MRRTRPAACGSNAHAEFADLQDSPDARTLVFETNGIASVETVLMNRIVFLLLAALPASAMSADIVADSPLELISNEFGLADGPAWNGFALDFPDVKGQKLFRYNPKTKKVQVLHGQAGRISATYFSHGQYFLSDNGNGYMARLNKGKIEQVTKPQGEGKDLARPNDLVVDANGGIYYTLTRQNRVMYFTPDGELTVAVPEVDRPNGLTLSPDGKTLYVAEYIVKKIRYQQN